MNTLKRIKVMNADGTPVKESTPSGREWDVNYARANNTHSTSAICFQHTGMYDNLPLFAESLPTYFRGKLKGKLQVSKDMETLIIDVNYWNELEATAKELPLYTNLGSTSKYRDYNVVLLPEYPSIEILIPSSTPSVVGMYEMVEADYFSNGYAIRSYDSAMVFQEKLNKFKSFRESKEWLFSIEKTGYEHDEDRSINIMIGGEWQYVTRMQAWEMKYWSKLVGNKGTCRVILGKAAHVIAQEWQADINAHREVLEAKLANKVVGSK